MKRSKLYVFLMVFFIGSCSVFNLPVPVYEMNPCFHLEDRELSVECHKWRVKYPSEYNRFYFSVKKLYPDSVWKKLPPPVEILLKEDKVKMDN